MPVDLAPWLGAAYGNRVESVELSCGRVVDARAMLKSPQIELETMISAADIAFLRGMLAHNPHLDPDATHEALLACERRHRIMPRKALAGRDAQRMLKHIVLEVQDAVAKKQSTPTAAAVAPVAPASP